MSESEATGVAENPPPYMIFVVVFLFFLTGLLGFLICHLLKKKGYRCRTGDMDDDDEAEEKLGGNADDSEEENQDTVEQILKCIIENEANMEAFNEMIGKQNVCVRHDPRLRKESIGGIPPHHHTVHSGSDHTSCLLCAQVKSKKGRRQSRTPRFKQRPGEQTVFSVGRFRVTHTDKKPQGSPNPLASSGDQLDQSQEEGGYNLRSMFKDVKPPSENTNGVAPPVGKRRKSLTIFGLRRGSDPVGVRAAEGTGREGGGVRFAVQKQPPAVLEEQSRGEDLSSPGARPGAEPSKSKVPASPKQEAETSDRPVANDVKAAPGDGTKQGVLTETGTSPGITAYPGQPLKAAEAPADLKKMVLKYDAGYDPGPVQTSTPIAPMYGSLIPTDQPQHQSSADYPVTQTPPDRSFSSDNEAGFGANLALISLGSSPPSSYQTRSQSSVSSLKTPTSPLAITPSPKLGSRSTVFSPILTPSPKLPSGRASSFGVSASPLQVRTPSPGFAHGSTLEATQVYPLTPSSPADRSLPSERSPRLTLKSGSVASPEQEGAGIPRPDEKKEVKRPGILKKPKPSPVEGSQLAEDRPSSLLLSPTSPAAQSPSSPLGARISSVTIVKASPDSKREFSVVTMVENEESSTLVKEQEREAPELESGTSGISPAGVGEGQKMAEKLDAGDSKVTQEGDGRSEEEKTLDFESSLD